MPHRASWAATAITLFLLVTFSITADATLTPVNNLGKGDGLERCLIGDSLGKCGPSGTYKNAYSITKVFTAWTGRSLVRVDDDNDKVFGSLAFGYIEVAGIAHYLSNAGTSTAGIWHDDGSFSGPELIPFPSGTEISPPDNRTVGVKIAGDTVTSDIITGRDFGASFVTLAVGSAPFEFVYRSGSEYYSSDNTSAGFSSPAGDHMVTFYAGTRTDGRGNQANVYLIAFERHGVDKDFQDGVYAVSIPLLIPVPEPAAYMSLAAGLCLLGWTALRRRNRR
jgi:hypothetical protein